MDIWASHTASHMFAFSAALKFRPKDVLLIDAMSDYTLTPLTGGVVRLLSNKSLQKWV